jgi:nucleoside-diphosphate-sugar epimerase
MADALIGHTGFVGSNLARQRSFDDFYNSRNIERIMGKVYNLIICAGARAEKWRINREPLKDLDDINRLKACLRTVTAAKMILISTIDVYPSPVGVDESTSIDSERCQPYGKHRLTLEKFVTDHFDSLVLRLPGLFGPGIKKNVIYDFLNRNSVEQIHADSVYQFYHLDNLWNDVQISLRHDLKLVNLATEPTSVDEIARDAFGFEFTNRPQQVPASYDMKSQYGHIFGSSTEYLYNKQQVLLALKEFIRVQKGIGE